MRSTPIRRIASTFAAICASLLLLSLFLLPLRYLGVTMGIIPSARTTAEAANFASESSDQGKAVMAEYCSEAVTANNPTNLSGRTSTSLVLSDAWLFQDASLYHHNLATACAVLAAVCNSESQYYSNVNGSIPYAEQALWALGFDNVRTESYVLRSGILDELGALLVDSHDVAAYTFASKTTIDPHTNKPVTLVFVGVRGSYGVEWLSNFNLRDAQGATGDHHGFGTAENEVEHALARYTHEIGADPAYTRILITGHSRGGAIANLLAARLNSLEGSEKQIAPASNIYAYTFAAPGSTRESNRQDAAYHNIFNIVNESDIVPHLPLSTWGYGRYGTTVSLPGTASEGFDGMLGRMQATFERNTGVAPAYDEADLESVATFAGQANKTLTSFETFTNLAGIIGTVQALFGMDFGTALSSHLPDTYIAWMQSTGSENLSFDTPDVAAPTAR